MPLDSCYWLLKLIKEKGHTFPEPRKPVITVAGTRVSLSSALEAASDMSDVGVELETIGLAPSGTKWKWAKKELEMMDWRLRMDSEVVGAELRWRSWSRILAALGRSNLVAMAKERRNRTDLRGSLNPKHSHGFYMKTSAALENFDH